MTDGYFPSASTINPVSNPPRTINYVHETVSPFSRTERIMRENTLNTNFHPSTVSGAPQTHEPTINHTTKVFGIDVPCAKVDELTQYACKQSMDSMLASNADGTGLSGFLQDYHQSKMLLDRCNTWVEAQQTCEAKQLESQNAVNKLLMAKAAYEKNLEIKRKLINSFEEIPKLPVKQKESVMLKYKEIENTDYYKMRENIKNLERKVPMHLLKESGYYETTPVTESFYGIEIENNGEKITVDMVITAVDKMWTKIPEDKHAKEIQKYLILKPVVNKIAKAREMNFPGSDEDMLTFVITLSNIYTYAKKEAETSYRALVALGKNGITNAQRRALLDYCSMIINS